MTSLGAACSFWCRPCPLGGKAMAWKEQYITNMRHTEQERCSYQESMFLMSVLLSTCTTILRVLGHSLKSFDVMSRCDNDSQRHSHTTNVSCRKQVQSCCLHGMPWSILTITGSSTPAPPSVGEGPRAHLSKGTL